MVTRPTFLITGATGLLGPYLVKSFSEHGRVVTTARRAGDAPCDLTDAAAVSALVREVNPDHVIHAAAMTNVDLCETKPADADAANRLATQNLADAMLDGSRLLYISTDQVYPDVAGPHVEGTERPINEYGRSKLAGELAALSRPGSLIARTNLFGPSITPGRASLSDFVVSALREGREITVFSDVRFSPLHLVTLSALLAELTRAGVTGTFNVGSRDGMSKADFAFAIAKHLGLSTERTRVGRSTEMPARAPRTADLRLDVLKVEQAVGRRMPTCLDEIARL